MCDAVLWCRWVCRYSHFGKSETEELSPASWRGFFRGRALCNQLCGSALGWRVCRMPGARSFRPLVQVQVGKPGSVSIMTQLAPLPMRGAFSEIKKPTLRLGVESAGLLPHAASPLRWIDQT